MKRLLSLAWLVAIATLPFSQAALAQRAKYEEMIATHAKANLVPETLVHRVITRESKYQASLLGSGPASRQRDHRARDSGGQRNHEHSSAKRPDQPFLTASWQGSQAPAT